jgi:hypothetical protein
MARHSASFINLLILKVLQIRAPWHSDCARNPARIAGDAMPRLSKEEIARDILSYFLRNPQAADDVEGLARWRLLREAIHRSIEETDHALEWLVEMGFLLKASPPGSNAIFSLNFQNLGRAESFVSNNPESGAGQGGPARSEPGAGAS